MKHRCLTKLMRGKISQVIQLTLINDICCIITVLEILTKTYAVVQGSVLVTKGICGTNSFFS